MANAAAEVDHVFAPGFPLLRGLPKFAADKAKDKEAGCNKYARTHPTLTPGLFTFFCAHGICIGFKLLMRKEGPSVAFEFIFTRFKKGVCR